MGKDGSKTIFVFGFYFTCIIVFMYVPLMPVLLECKQHSSVKKHRYNEIFLSVPTQLKLLKREYFNRWYGLNSYFLALTVSTIPIHTVFCTLYVGLVYFLTDQPLEVNRILMFYSICVITSFISESLGLMIGSVLSIVVSKKEDA